MAVPQSLRCNIRDAAVASGKLEPAEELWERNYETGSTGEVDREFGE